MLRLLFISCYVDCCMRSYASISGLSRLCLYLNNNKEWTTLVDAISSALVGASTVAATVAVGGGLNRVEQAGRQAEQIKNQ